MRKRSEYLAVQAKGRKTQSDCFLLLRAEGPDLPSTRIGVTVSSKVGNAVVRNRIKRWVREYVRRHREAWPSGELVIVAKPPAARVAHGAIDQDLARLLSRWRKPHS